MAAIFALPTIDSRCGIDRPGTNTYHLHIRANQ